MRSWSGDRAATVAVALAAVLAVVAAALRFDPSALPEVTRFRDDAYYYFVFARNLAEGGGPCVTPGAPTSGVHALWAAMLTVIHALRGDAGVVVGAQHLGLGLHALTAAGVFLLAGRTRLAAALALLYAGNPWLLAEVQNGQETALGAAATLLLWACRRAALGWFMAAAVLAVWSRSDLVFLVAGFTALRWWWRPPAWVVLGIVFVAYAGVNLLLAGRLVQDSAAPIPWLFHAHFLRTQPDFGDHLARLWWYLRPCLLGGPWGVAGPVWGAAVLALAAGPLRGAWRWAPLAATGAGWLAGASDVQVPLLAGVLLAFAPATLGEATRGARAAVLGFGALVSLHLVLRTYPRDYYFAPLVPLGAMALAALPTRLAWGGALLAAAGTITALAGPRLEQRWQEQMGMAGRYLRAVLPPGEPVGCFNSGIVQFHDPGPVLNLDGVVDARAFAALRAGRMGAWLDEQGVRFVLDSAIQFRLESPWPHASGAHFGGGFDPDRDLVEVARFVVPGLAEPFVAYWRRGHGVPPAAPASARDLGPAPGFHGRAAGRYVLWPAAAGAVLRLRRPDGTGDAVDVVRADRTGAVVVRVDAPAAGRWGLYEGDTTSPVLVIDL